MMRLGTSALLTALSLLTLAGPAPAGQGYVIVVNESNPLGHMRRAELSKVFLRGAPTWPSGAPALPCDLSSASPTRKAFSEAVHGKPLWMIVAYWQQELASGRNRPPAVCASEQAALQAVRDDPGAVAYVSEGLALEAGLKTLVLEP